MKKILVIFGNRPEAIKMCPLILELKSRDQFETIVCTTGQQRDMLNQVMDVFGIVPDHDLSVTKPKQTLYDLTINGLTQIRKILELENPALVLLHGDTTNTFAAALACFYNNIPVGHVEAGLRSGNIQSPYPEEFNRKAISDIAAIHFAPTPAARSNLLKEGVNPDQVFVTGNTVVDAMRSTISSEFEHDLLDWAKESRLLLVTAHRREHKGKPMGGIFHALADILRDRPDLKAIYTAEASPSLRESMDTILGDLPNLKLVPPLDVLEFHNIMAKADIVLTDSGGIQEEATALGKPVLVMRDSTDRIEGLESGALRLVGTQKDGILKALNLLLDDESEYQTMSQAQNPYGDGFASVRIADLISSHFQPTPQGEPL